MFSQNQVAARPMTGNNITRAEFRVFLVETRELLYIYRVTQEKYAIFSEICMYVYVCARARDVSICSRSRAEFDLVSAITLSSYSPLLTIVSCLGSLRGVSRESGHKVHDRETIFSPEQTIANL